MKRMHAIVSGRVQGVGFRYFVKHAASGLSLVGWVRNLSDGTVEVEVEGAEENLEEFRQKLWKGPGLGRVDDVKEVMLEPTGSYEGFSIRH